MDGFKVHTGAGVEDLFDSTYNTEVFILPPRLSHILQPLDGGPNRSLKALIRKYLVDHVRDSGDRIPTVSVSRLSDTHRC